MLVTRRWEPSTFGGPPKNKPTLKGIQIRENGEKNELYLTWKIQRRSLDHLLAPRWDKTIKREELIVSWGGGERKTEANK